MNTNEFWNTENECFYIGMPYLSLSCVFSGIAFLTGLDTSGKTYNKPMKPRITHLTTWHFRREARISWLGENLWTSLSTTTVHTTSFDGWTIRVHHLKLFSTVWTVIHNWEYQDHTLVSLANSWTRGCSVLTFSQANFTSDLSNSDDWILPLDDLIPQLN